MTTTRTMHRAPGRAALILALLLAVTSSGWSGGREEAVAVPAIADPLESGPIAEALGQLASTLGVSPREFRVDPAALEFSGVLDGVNPLARYWLGEPFRAPAMMGNLAANFGRSRIFEPDPRRPVTDNQTPLEKLVRWRFRRALPAPVPASRNVDDAKGLESAVGTLFEETGRRFHGRDREIMAREAATLPAGIAGPVSDLVLALGAASRGRDAVIERSGFGQGGIFRSGTRRTRDRLLDALGVYRDDPLMPEADLSGGLSGFSLERLTGVALELDRAAVDALAALSAEEDSLAGREFQFTWWTPRGRVALGGSGRNRYEDEYLLIVDFGGDDEYVGAGGVNAGDPGVALVLDFGGDDRYTVADSARAAAGGAVLGIAGVIDLKGDDTYGGDAMGAGFGFLGVGWVYDVAGDDRYQFASFAEGMGIFGIGLLADGSGRDVYDLRPVPGVSSAGAGQGAAGPGGTGILADIRGNDQYRAAIGDTLRAPSPMMAVQGAGFGDGPAPEFGATGVGGAGVLIDVAGNDLYESDLPGQGYAQWGGVGTVVDLAGNDRYRTTRSGQGHGVAGGFGLLFERAGDDSLDGGCPGSGSELGSGMVVDLAGDDVVRAMCAGTGVMGGAGFYIDGAGEDAWEFSPWSAVPRLGSAIEFPSDSGDRPAEFLSVPTCGIFVDIGGPDRFTGFDSASWSHASHGVRMAIGQGRGSRLRSGAWIDDRPSEAGSR